MASEYDALLREAERCITGISEILIPGVKAMNGSQSEIEGFETISGVIDRLAAALRASEARAEKAEKRERAYRERAYRERLLAHGAFLCIAECGNPATVTVVTTDDELERFCPEHAPESEAPN